MIFSIKAQFNRLSASFWGYVLVILAIVAPWFGRSGYLFFTDMSWGPTIRPNWTDSYFLQNLAVKVLSFIFPVDFLEKIFITVALTLILLGGRRFILAVAKFNQKDGQIFSRGLVFALSLFALFNPFVYDRALYGQFGVLIAYGSLFFIGAYLLETWQDLDFKKLRWVAVFSALALLFSVHFIFLLTPFYLLFFIGLFSKWPEIKSAGQSKKLSLSLLSLIVIILAINANWLMAMVFRASPLGSFIEQGITGQDLVAFQTAGKNGMDTLANVLLMSGFWGKDQFRYLDLTDLPGWQRSFVFLAPIILFGVYLSFRNKSRQQKILSLSLLFIFASAVFLAIGIKSPVTRDLSLFFYNHLPLYKGLRESQKWVAVIIPIYLFYLTLGARRLSEFGVIANNNLVSGLVFIAIIVMSAPSLLWGFNHQAWPTPYPNDWYEVNKLLLENSSESSHCSDKVVFLPWHMYMKFGWARKIIVNPASVFFACPTFNGTNMEWGGIYDNSLDYNGSIIDAWLKTQGQAGAPVLAGVPVRYIVLAKELDFANYFWINSLPYIKPLLETKTLLVYEIKS